MEDAVVERAARADLVLTGEGRLDGQTLEGKAVAALATSTLLFRVAGDRALFFALAPTLLLLFGLLLLGVGIAAWGQSRAVGRVRPDTRGERPLAIARPPLSSPVRATAP